MSLEILLSRKSKKSLKRLEKSGRFDAMVFIKIINLLAQEQILPVKNRDHALAGEYLGYRECHMQNDLLLIYRVYEIGQKLFIEDIGSHSELFG